MSTASHVPSVRDLDSTDIRETVGRVPVRRLLKDSFVRFRYSDGFSFARAMAFQLVLTLVPATIVVVGLAVWLEESRFQIVLREGISTLAPGPAGELFTSAFRQGSESGDRGDLLAVVAGAAAVMFSAIPAMAQLQRGASRIYGVDADRRTLHRYGLATLLTVSVGLLLVVAFLAIVVGSTVGGVLQGEVASIWEWARWPLGTTALAVALAALFKFAPNRPQPGFSWLLLGGGVAVVGWLLVSIGLSLYLNASSTLGQVYGPLAGFIGVMIWALLSSISIFFGLAVAAQLEAERVGVAGPTEEGRGER